MTALPTSWLVVGGILIVTTLIAVVWSLLKSREAATLKKEVEELRDTIRMMRYEEANLSRMLHTVDKPADIQENVSPQDDSSEPEIEDKAPAAPLMAEEDNSPFEESLEDNNETLAKEEQEVTETTAKIEEPEEPVAESAPEESQNSIEAAMPEEPAEEESDKAKPRKHAINERRPAIPNDLFSAWFEENEQYEAKQEIQNKEVVTKVEEAEVEEAEPQKLEVAEPQPQDSELVQVDSAPTEDIPTPAITEVAEEKEPTTADEPVAEQPAVPIVLSKEDERFCRKLERVVNARMRNPNLNIDIIASQFGMGRTNFYRKVRELMGVSPNDYLRKCRMERAAELLCSSELAVVDICAQVGIPDAQYFSRVFKTYFGMPPSIYREQKLHG